MVPRQSMRKVLVTAWVIYVSKRSVRSVWGRSPTKSKICKQNGRLDAADVDVVHDLDGQCDLDEDHHVIGSEILDWEPDVVFPEYQYVDQIPNSEQLLIGGQSGA